LFILITGGSRALGGRFSSGHPAALARALHRVGFLLLVLAMHVYVGRFELLFEHHTIFEGVTYTDAHVTLTGMLIVCAALVLGAAIAIVGAVFKPRGRWLVAAIASGRGLLCRGRRGWLVRQQLYRQAERTGSRAALYCLQHRDDAAGIRPGPLRAARVSRRDHRRGAADPANNQATLRTSGCGTGARCRTRCARFRRFAPTTTFPTSTSIAMRSTAQLREVMLAARELNVDKLPESSRNWINDKLIYTHGYGITMNPVNGFTPEGCPR
jgi:hypothetical protein